MNYTTKNAIGSSSSYIQLHKICLISLHTPRQLNITEIQGDHSPGTVEFPQHAAALLLLLRWRLPSSVHTMLLNTG